MQSYCFCVKCGLMFDVAERGVSDSCGVCHLRFSRRRWRRARVRYSRWRRGLNRISRIAQPAWAGLPIERQTYEAQIHGAR
jgi:hypothetical protein